MAEAKSDRDFLLGMEQVLAEDLLDPAYPIEVVETELRERGHDPAAVAARGRELARQILERRRLSWKEGARAKMDAAGQSLARRRDDLAKMTRAELLNIIAGLQRDKGLCVAFQKRRPEAASDDELRELIEDAELLRSSSGPGDR